MKPSYELLLIRHGETDHVARGLLQGHTDVPLNEAGRAQAFALQPRLTFLRALEPVVFSSDLIRARATAELACPWATPRIDARLREMNFGAFEGRTFDDNRRMFGETFTDWMSAPAVKRPPAGETVAELQARLLEWLNSIEKGTTVVFAHGGVLRALISWARGVTMDWSLSIPPVSAVWLRLSPDRKPLGELDWLNQQQAAS